MSDKKVYKNRLTQPQFAKLCQVLLLMKDHFIAEKISRKEALAQLKNALGFEVSDSSLNQAQATFDIHWDDKGQRGFSNKDRADAKYRLLAREIQRLQESLGMTVHPGIVEMASAKATGKIAHEEMLKDSVPPADKPVPTIDPKKTVQTVLQVASNVGTPPRVELKVTGEKRGN